VKTDVEELSPTRVKLVIEVPFDELKPSLDKAYREVAKQVRIPGFRPGRVPPRIIDQRIGRGAVLEQAVNDAVPQLYDRALVDNEVFALGQPKLEITSIDDGEQLSFTAEVDVRPKFEVPSVAGLPVTVADADVTPDDVEEYLGGLRERFASLKTVDRPAEPGDYVSIDLAASVDGAEVEDAQASGLSYRIGDDTLLDGLDAVLTGITAGGTATFGTELAGGSHAGQQAEVRVTAHSVKVKEMPELDDEFAQSASEFDTIGELRASTRSELERFKRLRQAGQAREGALDALLDRIDVPLPDAVVEAEVERRNRAIDDQMERVGASRETYLASAGKSADDLAADIERDARRGIRANFVLDQFALQENLEVTDGELTGFVLDQAQRMGVQPDQLAAHLRDSGQLGAAFAEVLRAKALDLIASRVAVTDGSGRVVDLTALLTRNTAPDDGPASAAAESADEDAAAAEVAGPAPS
jgi:trigger factor